MIIKEIIEQQRELIQGWCPALVDKDDIDNLEYVDYIAFNGGYTYDYLEALCLNTKEEAIEYQHTALQQNHWISIAIPINGLCEPVWDKVYIGECLTN
jgi:hypothetical protein